MCRALLIVLALPVFTTLALQADPQLDPTGAKELSGFLAETVRRGEVPGVVLLVVTPERTIYHEAFGRMDAAHEVDMRKDTIFRIASMTKPITSAAVMLLVEEGKLALDDPIGNYLPAFRHPQVISRVDLSAGTFETRPATRPITIRQLLTHTSGIGYSWSDPGLALIAKLTGKTSEADLPLVNEPGAQWTYGASPKVLGELVEHVSGQPLELFLEERVFRPLGMVDTGWSVPDEKRFRVATLHQRKDGRLQETPNPPTLSVQPRGDGRLFSTAADYGRFMQMILNRGRVGTTRLLKPETVTEMGRDQTAPLTVRLQPTADPDYTKPFPLGSGEDGWGLGFQLAMPSTPARDMRRRGSMSWAGINNTFFWIDPQARLAVVVLMQFLPFYDEKALSLLRGVESRVYRHLEAPREITRHEPRPGMPAPTLTR